MQPHRETHEMTKTRKCFWRFVRVSGETSGSATDVLVIAPSAATHLTRRPRARNETARGSRLPRLMRLVFCGACGSRGGYLRRLGRSLSRGFGACGRRPCLVFLQTAVLVFSARAAMTWLVAARSFTGLSSHCDECTVPMHSNGIRARPGSFRGRQFRRIDRFVPTKVLALILD